MWGSPFFTDPFSDPYREPPREENRLVDVNPVLGRRELIRSNLPDLPNPPHRGLAALSRTSTPASHSLPSSVGVCPGRGLVPPKPENTPPPDGRRSKSLVSPGAVSPKFLVGFSFAPPRDALRSRNRIGTPARDGSRFRWNPRDGPAPAECGQTPAWPHPFKCIHAAPFPKEAPSCHCWTHRVGSRRRPTP